MKQLKKTLFCNCRSKTNCPVNGDVLLKESFIKQQLCITTRKIFKLVQLEDNSKTDFMNIRNPLEMRKRKKVQD